MAALTRSPDALRLKHLLMPFTGSTLAVLLALLVMCCTAVASPSVIAPSDSLCAGSAAQSGCASTPAIAGANDGEGQEGEEEIEEGEDEEAATRAAKPEQAPVVPQGSPSTRSSRPSPNPASATVVSHLRLTVKATAALKQPQPSAATVGFSFMLSAPATLEVTFVKQTSVHGHERWAMLPDSLVLKAFQGHVEGSLTGHNKLSPGHYRLTVKPIGGSSRSIFLSVRR